MSEKKLSNRYDGMTLEQELKSKQNRSLSHFDGGIFDVTALGLTKTISLTNSDTTTKRIAIFPGNLQSVEEILSVIGASVDAIAKEGTVAEKVSVVASGLSYAQRHFVRNPTRISEIQVSVDNQSQLAQPIEVYNISPFRKNGSVQLIPKSYQRATDSNVNLVSVPTDGFQLDDQTCWIVTVGPSRSIDLTFFTGAVRNDAYLLKKAGETLA